jgi:hypothetical protein
VTLGAAVAASSPGDRIQVLPGTANEAALVVDDKSLEIFGTGATCIVSRSDVAPVIKITAANVFVHDLAVTNMQAPSLDGGGQSSCITAPTMVEGVSEQGLPGIYITRCRCAGPP